MIMILDNQNKIVADANQSMSDFAKAYARYRIVKDVLASGEERFYIQKKRRIFLIGPKVWITFKSIPNHYCDDYGFFLLGDRENMGSLDNARQELQKMIKVDLSWVKKREVVEQI